MAPPCPATQQRCFTINSGMEHSAAASEIAMSSAEGLGHLVPTARSLPGMQCGSNPAGEGWRHVGMGCLQGGAGAVPGRGAGH